MTYIQLRQSLRRVRAEYLRELQSLDRRSATYAIDKLVLSRYYADERSDVEREYESAQLARSERRAAQP